MLTKNYISQSFTLLLLSLLLTSSLFAAPGTLDWDAVTWPNPPSTSDFSNTYAVTGGNLAVDITGDITTLQDPPALLTLDTGGTGELTLDLFLQFNDLSENLVITLSFDQPGGVSNLQFNIFDVDENAPVGYTDIVMITATDGNSTFNPTFTTSLCNTQINANTVSGQNDCNSNDNPNTTVGVAFAEAGINTVTIVYSDTAPAISTQAITLHDINFEYNTADVSITKSDQNLTYTPGEAFQYTILVSNAGPDDADDATVADTLAAWALPPTAPGLFQWECGSETGGAACLNANGTGDINETIPTFPANSSVTFTVNGIYSSDMNDYP